jgi:hypothetical protein
MNLGFKSARPGDPISASQQNEIRKVLASMLRSSGANFYADSQGLHHRPAPQEPAGAAWWIVAVVLTDSAQALTGNPTIDGYTVAPGDDVLRVCDDTDDGIYTIPTGGGAWKKIAKLPGGAGAGDTLDAGELILSFTGNSCPHLYSTDMVIS